MNIQYWKFLTVAYVTMLSVCFSFNKAGGTLKSLGAQDTSTFKEFKGFYKIPTTQVPSRPKIPKDSKEFKRTPKNFNCSSPRPTYKFQRISKEFKGSQRIPKDPKESSNTPKFSKKVEKLAKDSKNFKNSKELISKELKERARALEKLMCPAEECES